MGAAFGLVGSIVDYLPYIVKLVRHQPLDQPTGVGTQGTGERPLRVCGFLFQFKQFTVQCAGDSVPADNSSGDRAKALARRDIVDGNICDAFRAWTELLTRRNNSLGALLRAICVPDIALRDSGYCGGSSGAKFSDVAIHDAGIRMVRVDWMAEYGRAGRLVFVRAANCAWLDNLYLARDLLLTIDGAEIDLFYLPVRTGRIQNFQQ